MRRALAIGLALGLGVGTLVGGALAALGWLLQKYDEAEMRGGAD